MKHDIIISLLCMNLLAGCAAIPFVIVGGAAATGGYYVGQDERTAKRIAKDSVITAEINAHILSDDMLKSSILDININTYRGSVTLSGSLPKQEMINRTIQIAKGVDGVKELNSLLTVKISK
ncbi:MAG: BON domain-containing protein [SAR324 cluster bacterium]|nr:BON domain-containing protein [SAR324 cluster bacterium]